LPRPKKERKIQLPPVITYFKPSGMPTAKLEHIILSVDEFEALRLVDYKKMSQKDAAELLGISRPTCARIIDEAHSKIAEALALGKAIRIEGGNYALLQNLLRCKDCGTSWEAPGKKAENTEVGNDMLICPECDGSNTIDLGETLINRTAGKRIRKSGVS
jgi:predicted DNA-binding protein (UPF0251 family)